MGKHPENLDFPMSRVFREFTSDTIPVSGLKTRKPKKIKVAGMTLHNISPDTPIDDTNNWKLEENLETLGIQPKTNPSSSQQSDFLNLVPPEAKAKSIQKGRPPKPINPPWHGDPQPAIAIITDPDKRRRALGSDGGHEATIADNEQRKKLRLSAKAMPFKDRLKAINALTAEELTIIQEILGYNSDRIPQYAPITQEIILRRLHEYKNWKQKQRTEV